MKVLSLPLTPINKNIITRTKKKIHRNTGCLARRCERLSLLSIKWRANSETIINNDQRNINLSKPRFANSVVIRKCFQPVPNREKINRASLRFFARKKTQPTITVEKVNSHRGISRNLLVRSFKPTNHGSIIRSRSVRIPCQAPQATKVQFAPCQSPLNRKVTKRLKVTREGGRLFPPRGIYT